MRGTWLILPVMVLLVVFLGPGIVHAETLSYHGGIGLSHVQLFEMESSIVKGNAGIGYSRFEGEIGFGYGRPKWEWRDEEVPVNLTKISGDLRFYILQNMLINPYIGAQIYRTGGSWSASKDEYSVEGSVTGLAYGGTAGVLVRITERLGSIIQTGIVWGNNTLKEKSWYNDGNPVTTTDEEKTIEFYISLALRFSF